MTETLMSRPLTDPGEALTVAARAAVMAEVERVHHDHECTGLPAGWVALSVPEPCERCGTRVFALRRVAGIEDRSTSRPQVFHVGWLVQRDAWVRMVAHTPGLCRQVRDGGPPLEGRRAAARANRGVDPVTETVTDPFSDTGGSGHGPHHEPAVTRATSTTDPPAHPAARAAGRDEGQARREQLTLWHHDDTDTVHDPTSTADHGDDQGGDQGDDQGDDGAGWSR